MVTGAKRFHKEWAARSKLCAQDTHARTPDPYLERPPKRRLHLIHEEAELLDGVLGGGPHCAPPREELERSAGQGRDPGN